LRARAPLAVALNLGQPRGELVDDMAQAMRLLLACNVADDPAGILHILMAVEYLRHRDGLGARGIPQMYGEDQRVPARVVVKHRFGRRVRQDAAVPIKLAIDAHRRKCRRQRARRHNVFDAELAIAAVEIPHLAGPNMGRADGQTRHAVIDQIEIDEFTKGLFQWRG
jgi:hypothetical protein